VHQRIGRRALFSGLAAMLLILMYLSLAIGYRLYSPGEICRDP
jgi:iron complex transport system permease protein